jgi:NTE family protein
MLRKIALPAFANPRYDLSGNAGSLQMTSRHQEAIDLLEDLPAAARKALLARERRILLEAGQPLFEAGEPAEALYIVNKGTLAVYIDRPGTGRHLLALIRQGEVIGEMAVISGGPRTASAVAIRDSELITVPAPEFRELQRRYPELARALNRLLVRRLRHTSLGGASSEPKTNAVIPASKGVDAEAFARRLAEELARTGASVHVVPPGDDDSPAPDLARLEAAHDHVFLCGDLNHREWSDMCARQADRIIALVPADGSLDPRFPRTLLAQRAAHQLANLVLLHRSPAQRPLRTTGQWLDTLNPSRHFHLRARAKRDWQHLARVIAGTSVGLVLSGGGARAFAHIGVLRAIEEAQIPIDFIGGSSMGGIIAACHASGWSAETIIERFRASSLVTNPLSDYSLPLIGLVRGRRVEGLLESPSATAISQTCGGRSSASRPTSQPPRCMCTGAASCARRCAPAFRCRASCRRCRRPRACWSTAASWTICRLRPCGSSTTGPSSPST